MFKRAVPLSSRLKLGMYGRAGSGKSFTALLFAEGLAKERGTRIAYIDTEMSTRWYRQPRPDAAIHPEPFDFDVIDTASISTALSAVKSLDPATHGVVVVDSVSVLWDASIAAVESRTKAGTIELRDWGKVKAPFKELIRLLVYELPVDALILGREKNEFGTGADGQLTKTGVTMKAEGETPYEPDILLHLEAKKDTKNPSKSTYLMWCEKDRTGVLAGRTVANATYATIEPIVSLLGSEQDVVLEPEEDRIARDSDMTRQSEVTKRTEKEKKSKAAFDECAERIRAAKDVAELDGPVTDAIAKVRAKLTDRHLSMTRDLFKEQRATLQGD